MWGFFSLRGPPQLYLVQPPETWICLWMNEWAQVLVHRNLCRKNPRASSSEGSSGCDSLSHSCVPGMPTGEADDKHKCEAFRMSMLTQSAAWKELSDTTSMSEISWPKILGQGAKNQRVPKTYLHQERGVEEREQLGMGWANHAAWLNIYWASATCQALFHSLEQNTPKSLPSLCWHGRGGDGSVGGRKNNKHFKNCI